MADLPLLKCFGSFWFGGCRQLSSAGLGIQSLIPLARRTNRTEHHGGSDQWSGLRGVQMCETHQMFSVACLLRRTIWNECCLQKAMLSLITSRQKLCTDISCFPTLPSAIPFTGRIDSSLSCEIHNILNEGHDQDSVMVIVVGLRCQTVLQWSRRRK